MKDNFGHIYLILSVFFTIFLSSSLFGQSSNELKSEQLFEEYEQFKNHRLTDVTKALQHANKAYELSIEIADSSYMNKSARAIGWLLSSIGEYDTAFFYLKVSISISKKQKNLKQLKFVYNDAGLNRLNLSIYDEALDYFNESLKVRDELKDYAGKAVAYNNIGLVYYNLENFSEAINFFKKGLAISEEFDNTIVESMNLVNIGLSYHFLRDYRNAQNYFERTLAKCQEDCPVDVEIQAIGAIGIIYYDTKQYDDAYDELNLAIIMSIENNEIKHLPSYYNYLALIEFERKEFNKAFRQLKISDDYANRLQNVEWKKNNLELYAKIYAVQGDYKSAYEYEVKLLAAKDSLVNAEVIKNISDIHVSIQQDKSDTIILGKDLQITERNQQLILFAATIFLSMILLVLLYRNNKFRKRLNEKLDYKVQERTKKLNKTNEALIDSRTELDNFIYKISHDIQGPLATLQGICDVGLIDVKDDTGRKYLTHLSDTAVELNGIIHRLQTVNQIISTSLDYTEVNFNTLIEKAIAKERAQSENYEKVETTLSVQEGLGFKTDVDLITIIVNNLISNAFQFYDNQKEQCIIDIVVSEKDDCLSFAIRDNGIGIELEDTKDLFRMFSRFSDRNRTGGIGLFLVKTAVDKLFGTIAVNEHSEDEYTTFAVELPYSTQQQVKETNNKPKESPTTTTV